MRRSCLNPQGQLVPSPPDNTARRLRTWTYGHRKGVLLRSFAMAKGRGSSSRFELLQGTLDLMVLQTLDAMGPQHGYGIARRIEQMSEDILRLNEGTVYAALMRLQHQRWISSSWYFRIEPQSQVLRDYCNGQAPTGTRGRSVGSARRPGGKTSRRRLGPSMLTRFRTIASRARFMIERRRLDEDMRQEIDAHIESLAEGYRRQGMSADEAYLAARRQFGNIALLRQDIREMNRIPWIEHTIQDVRYAVRLLWRAKAFTTAAVLTLALGIAATTVMFALIQGVLLRPLPVQEQDRLILSWREAPTAGSAFYPFGDVEIEAIARDSQLLENAAGVTRNGVWRAVVSDGITSSYANVGLITGGFFEVLGAQALLGRRFTLGDDREGAEPAAVISHGYWQRHFGGVPDVIGRRITVNEQRSVIVGVMPSDLDYPRGVDIWRTTRSIPADSAFGIAAQREVNLIARLRPGVTIEQASSELAALDQQLATDAPTDYLRRGFNIVVRPFAEVVIGDVRRTMIALFGAVAFVLLIASANVANLLLMRGESRGGELALRAALGAARGRIAGQVLAESLVLSLIAGLAGFLLAWVALPLLITIIPDGLPRIESIRIDATVAAFLLGWSSSPLCLLASRRGCSRCVAISYRLCEGAARRSRAPRRVGAECSWWDRSRWP